MSITLSIRKAYKSIPLMEEKHLPSFCVLTGKNGSGKTHFLEALADNDYSSVYVGGELIKDVKYIGFGSLKPGITENFSPTEISDLVRGVWEYFSQERTKKNSVSSLDQIYSNLGSRLRDKDIVQKVLDDTGKSLSDLTETDLLNNFDTAFFPRNPDFFAVSFASIFKLYSIKERENDFNRFNSSQGHSVLQPVLTEDEFRAKYGEPPWDFVNKIFEEAHIPYEVNNPKLDHQAATFVLKLKDRELGFEIRPGDLSTGEKILMSLALAFYNSKLLFEFPKVLLIDEPDAGLHPSMSKKMIDVIQRVFVEEKGMTVVVTTHSPSTVALCPEESLFVMNRCVDAQSSNEKIKKVSKDKALKILLSGVPSLSIDYENRKQVFVESKYDALFYEKCLEALRDRLLTEVSLNFISSGSEGSGSCTQVRAIVDNLRNAGNQSVFGIIDWDGSNEGSEHVKVLGKNQRYCMENYIFDPLLAAALLLREKIIQREDVGLLAGQNYWDFPSLDASQLQFISDFVVKKVHEKFQSEDVDGIKAKYVNNIELQIPQWYLQCNGHDLEDKLKEAFPALKRFSGPFALKKEVINKIIDEIPTLIPADILKVLQSIEGLDDMND